MYCVYTSNSSLWLWLCSKEKQRTKKVIISLVNDHNDMSTGIAVQCHFVLSSCVLCIVLTNPQNHWAALKKRKERKGESSTVCTYFLLIRLYTWKHVIQLSGVSANFWLNIMNGQNYTLSNYQIGSFIGSVPSKFLRKLLIR